jgi:hypothetical protein
MYLPCLQIMLILWFTDLVPSDYFFKKKNLVKGKLHFYPFPNYNTFSLLWEFLMYKFDCTYNSTSRSCNIAKYGNEPQGKVFCSKLILYID